MVGTTNWTDFYDAAQARQIARGGGAPLGVILTEISYIKAQIDTTVVTGGLSVYIVDATPMTTSEAYYNAWNNPLIYNDNFSVLARSRMESVIRYFTTLGYRVQRQRVNFTDFMMWVISW